MGVVETFVDIIKGNNGEKKEPIYVTKKELKEKKQKLSELNKRKKVKSKLPKSTQGAIPYITDYDEGIFEIEKDKYSITLTFSDINYQTSRVEEQQSMFMRYTELLNYFSPEVEFSITLNNKNIDINELKEEILISDEKNDGLDKYRIEYNQMLMKQVSAGRNELKREKMITITIKARNIMEAMINFNRIELEIVSNFQQIGSKARRLSTSERLELLHDIFRNDQIGNFDCNGSFDYAKLKANNLSAKDYIAPSVFKFDTNEILIGDRYARCVFINNLPSYMSDKFLAEITDSDFNMVTTLSMQAVAPQDAIKIVRRQILGMESNKIEQQKKAIKAGYDPNMINHNLKHSLEEAEELLDYLQNKNQKMFLVSIVLMPIANTKEDLKRYVDSISAIARKYLCQVQKLSFQQKEAFNQVLPLGHNTLLIKRTLTTDSTAIFMPFTSQELFQEDGMYYGLNGVSKNLIMLNRKNLKNPNGFILGTPGSGKSFSAKREIVNVLLNTDDDVIIIDPEREYTPLAGGFEGEVIPISAGSKHYLNPFDMSEDYADEENPLTLKSDFVLSLCEILIGGKNGLTPVERSLVDRCLNRCFSKYLETMDIKDQPTLKNFYEEMLKQSKTDPEARGLASALEIYTTGNLSVFANRTNVDVNNRFIIYDIKDLGKNLKTVGMLVVLDSIWNRITQNRMKGKRTWVYVDEIYLLFANEYSANYFFELWKRARKWGAIPTGITQNVEDLLKSDTARTMLSNSEFLLLLNQAYSDKIQLQELLNISDTQLSYVTNVEAGKGLIRAGENIIPFIDSFPKKTKLYEMMTTNPDEIAKMEEEKQLNV